MKLGFIETLGGLYNNSLEPFSLKNKLDTFQSLYGVRPSPFLIDNPVREISLTELSPSIHAFVESFTDSGEFNRSLTDYLNRSEAGSHLNPREFSLVAHSGPSTSISPPYDTFFMDGASGLILTYGKPKDRNSVIASVDPLFRVNQSNRMSQTNHDYKDIVINQLQGPLKNFSNPEFRKIFTSFRWEHLLVDCLVSWAWYAGLQRLLLLPSYYNYYGKVKRNENGSAIMRYDVTAERRGFRRTKETEAYSILFDRGMVIEAYKQMFGQQS